MTMQQPSGTPSKPSTGKSTRIPINIPAGPKGPVTGPEKKGPLPSPAPGQRSPKLSGQHGLSFTTCVKTLTNVTISRRGLLNLELAVGLAIFLDAGIANKTSKGMLQEIYAKAGYDCEKSDGKDYKTVNRRIQASSGLFGKLGLEVINHWAGSQKENKLLQSLAHELTKLEFKSLDDVLDYIGRTSNRTSPKRGAGEAERDEAGKGPEEVSKDVWDIEVGPAEHPIHVRLPHTLTEAELVELASKIMALAETVHEAATLALSPSQGGQQAPAAAPGEAGAVGAGPSEGEAPEGREGAEMVAEARRPH